MNRADRALADALERWRNHCVLLQPSDLRQALAAWDDGDQVKSDGDAALVHLVAEIIRARDECPGKDADWQHPLLLAGRAVRAAVLLAKRQSYRKPRKRKKPRK